MAHTIILATCLSPCGQGCPNGPAGGLAAHGKSLLASAPSAACALGADPDAVARGCRRVGRSTADLHGSCPAHSLFAWFPGQSYWLLLVPRGKRQLLQNRSLQKALGSASKPAPSPTPWKGHWAAGLPDLPVPQVLWSGDDLSLLPRDITRRGEQQNCWFCLAKDEALRTSLNQREKNTTGGAK